jgi:TPR repeat protein
VASRGVARRFALGAAALAALAPLAGVGWIAATRYPGETLEVTKIRVRAQLYREPSAMTSIGMCLTNGIGVTEDRAAGYKWIRSGAEAGDADGLYWSSYFSTVEVERETFWAEAESAYRKRAMEGDAYAMRRLGKMLLDNFGPHLDHAVFCVPTDAERAEAEAWLRKADQLEARE